MLGHCQTSLFTSRSKPMWRRCNASHPGSGASYSCAIYSYSETLECMLSTSIKCSVVFLIICCDLFLPPPYWYIYCCISAFKCTCTSNYFYESHWWKSARTTLWGIKNTPKFIYHNLQNCSPILIILVHIFLTQLAIKWPFSFQPHQRLLVHYLGKTKLTKYALKSTKTLINFISGSVVFNS